MNLLFENKCFIFIYSPIFNYSIFKTLRSQLNFDNFNKIYRNDRKRCDIFSICRANKFNTLLIA